MHLLEDPQIVSPQEVSQDLSQVVQVIALGLVLLVMVSCTSTMAFSWVMVRYLSQLLVPAVPAIAGQLGLAVG